ncbi:MAG: DUF4190 domain-containing protein [Planctomycetaceae bacterium]|nr:DUF4190 domain-containing protein [Planctomycetaceae bacterium]
MRPSVPDVHITDPQDEELCGYRPVSAQAVAGLIFGLLAPAAFLGPMLWTLPAIGAVLSYRALRRIRQSEPALAGRKLAWLGLVLSLFCLIAAPTDWGVYRWRVRNDARELAVQWFRYLSEDEPHMAHQLTLPSANRQPLDERLWTVYRENARLRQQLEKYVADPAVRTLLALGSKVRVRFYETAEHAHTEREDVVSQLFAVTYDEAGEQKSFFVSVETVRRTLPSGKPDWRIVCATGGVKPEEW